MESDRIQAEALVVKALPATVSNWRSQRSLTDFLIECQKQGIAGIDTRKLTRLLREKGAQDGCVVAHDVVGPATVSAAGIEAALAAARDFPGLAGLDLARVVSVDSAYEWKDGTWRLGEGHRKAVTLAASGSPKTHGGRPLRVVAFDYGFKWNILRLLADRGCQVTVVPATTSAEEAMALRAGRHLPGQWARRSASPAITPSKPVAP